MPNHAWNHQIDQTIASELVAGHELIEHILGLLGGRQWDGRDLFAVRLALEEAVVNAIKHGNRLDLNKKVHVICQISDQRCRIQVTDEGSGFNPEAVADCTDEEHIELPNGRGIMLMRNFMTHVEYNDRGNVVTMEKWREGAN